VCECAIRPLTLSGNSTIDSSIQTCKNLLVCVCVPRVEEFIAESGRAHTPPMRAARSLVLVPGLLCTPRLFRSQVEALNRAGIDARVVDVSKGDFASMDSLAERILAEAPTERFSIAGLSMGGYAALAVYRAAPQRVERLALLSSQARSDTAQTRERRKTLVTLARREGHLHSVMDLQMPLLLAPRHLAEDRSPDE
jgi:pimeloyl-ACP methyl ester carboxylesterase